jgi:hypothetical protein
MANKPKTFTPKNHKRMETTMTTEINELASRIARSSMAVIDTIVQRGGFRGEELSTIGALRDQCVQVIAKTEAAAQEAAENTV